MDNPQALADKIDDLTGKLRRAKDLCRELMTVEGGYDRARAVLKEIKIIEGELREAIRRYQLLKDR